MRRGFTLLELLIVIVIIGVIAMMVGPTFTSGSDVARVKTASRGVMQLSRYARTMALLHQTPVDLVFTSDGGVSVAQVGDSGASVVSAKAFTVTNSAAEAAQAEDAPAVETPPAASGGAGQGGGSAYVMADLAIDKKYEQVEIVFEGYTDTLDEGRHPFQAASAIETEADGSADREKQTFRVRYKSNGTCRPYKIRVSAEGDEHCAMTVVVDLLGSAKIETEDE